MDEQNEDVDLDTEFTVVQRIVVGIGMGLVVVGMLLGIAIVFGWTNKTVFLMAQSGYWMVFPLCSC